ncbi:UDP-4-amino-4,6-dideoxy-N-acetyl-beta-L-altrosamine N-acetyltransferase [Paracoccus sp. p3-h83]|uniref:UDP-4-amino-4, 6-dideoxy-N-acetyl-beta-L-altrosamine N-acetyltransferase n=1 Tax=Paracoccus sp. p3-h83 TaxID=3342805 RepID=UPI0035BAE4C7
MTENCRIRPLAEADLPMVLAWRNAPAVRAVMFTRHEITLDEHRLWFARVSQDPSRCLILVEDTSGPIGYAQFADVEPGGVADWGFYARPGAPKGTGQRLGRAALDHAFGPLGLHKVCGQAIGSNLPSIRLHLRLGFTQEGVLRDQRRRDGGYDDLVCFGLLASEWQRDGHSGDIS